MRLKIIYPKNQKIVNKTKVQHATYDGQTYIAFCCQKGIKSPNGSEYTFNGDFYVQYKQNLPQYEKIAEMIYFGYTMKYGLGLPSSDEAYRAACCTQQYVWEYIHNNINSSFDAFPRDSWNGNFMSSGHYANWVAEAEGYYNQYHGNTSFNGSTQSVAIGESKVITDSNGKLSAYQSFSQSKDGVTFSHTQGSNDLVVTISGDCNAENVTFNSREYGLYQLMPNGSAYNSSTMSNYMYFTFTSGSVQNLIFSNYVDPSAFSVSVHVESGKIEIRKTNNMENAVSDCVFDLYKNAECTDLVKTATTNNEGKIVIEKLKPGTYYVKEISAPKGYQKSDKVVKVEINDKGIFVDGKQIEKDNNEVYSFEFEDYIIETQKTGDEGHIRIWFAVLGISLVAFLGAIIYFKKFLEK